MISQPRYLPAVNYLQRIYNSEYFVVLDTVQHNKQDFEHRNKVAGDCKPHWLSLSLDRSQGSRIPIRSVKLQSSECLDVHRELLHRYYRNSDNYSPDIIDYLYSSFRDLTLVSVTNTMLIRLFESIGLSYESKSRIILASSLQIEYRKGPSYLADICKFIGGNQYVSGPNGRHYIRDEFSTESITLLWHDFIFPEYKRSGLPFIPWLAAIDILQHCGFEALRDIISKSITLGTS